jgi:hypothetical protein
MTSLAVCAIFKNEAPFLLEWIAYHHAAGVSHFYLYDNDSDDGGAELIGTSPLASLVTVTHWPQRPGQLAAYRDFIGQHATAHDWVAFIDIDEFILPLRDDSITTVLDRRAGYGAVLVQWRVFGPSGHVTRPPGLVMEAYTRRTTDDFPANAHIKSIVRCSALLDVTHNPHAFVVRGAVCNAAGLAVDNVAIQPMPCHTDLVINHYQTRSRQDWAAKIARGSAMFDYTEPKYPAELVEHYETCSVETDTAIWRFLPQVKAALGPAAVPQWIAQPPSGFRHPGGQAVAFSQSGRPNGAWLAAVCGTGAAGQTDPQFLLDLAGRIAEFPSLAEAQAACEAVLRARAEARPSGLV